MTGDELARLTCEAVLVSFARAEVGESYWPEPATWTAAVRAFVKEKSKDAGPDLTHYLQRLGDLAIQAVALARAVSVPKAAVRGRHHAPRQSRRGSTTECGWSTDEAVPLARPLR